VALRDSNVHPDVKAWRRPVCSTAPT